MSVIAPEKKSSAQVLEELKTKSFEYRDGFVAGMLYAQSIFNSTPGEAPHAS